MVLWAYCLLILCLTQKGANMFFPFPLYLHCTHVVIAVCVITKTGIRHLCGLFQFEHNGQDSSMAEQPYWNRMQVYLLVWIMPGSNSDSCLLIVCFQTCLWSDGLDVLVLSVPSLVSLYPPFFFLGS